MYSPWELKHRIYKHVKTKYIIRTKEGSTKIESFMTLGARVLVLGRGHISRVVKMNYFF